MQQRTETARIQYMLNATSRHLLKIFKERFKQRTGLEWQDNPSMGNYYVDKIDSLSQCTIEKQETIRSGTASTWDLSSLITAINGIRVPNNKKTQREDEHVRNIKTIRNSLAHAAPRDMIELDPNIFDQYFKVLRAALTYFGEKKVDIEKYKLNDLSSFTASLNESASAASLEDLQRLAEEALNTHQYSKAVSLFGKALQERGTSEEQRGNLLFGRSQAQLKLLQYRQNVRDQTLSEEDEEQILARILSDVKAAHKAQPDSLAVYYSVKGQVYLLQKRYGKAVKTLELALSHDPNNEELFNYRSLAKYESTKIGADNPLTHHAPVFEELGLFTEEGEPVNEKNIERVIARADNRTGYADYLRGRMYESGHRGLPQFEKAVTYFRRAADKGSLEGMMCMTECCMDGRGMKQDLAQGIEWMEKVIALPDRKPDGTTNWPVCCAQYHYGVCLIDGVGKRPDVATGLRWVTKASDNGMDMAQWKLGSWYLRGTHVVKDKTKGFKLLLAAAMGGLVSAMEEVAECYIKGKAVERNYDEAEKWLQRAVDKGYHVAGDHLAALRELRSQITSDTDVIQLDLTAQAKTQKKNGLVDEVQDMIPRISNSTSEYGKYLKQALKYSLYSHEIVKRCYKEKKCTLEDSLEFVQMRAAALKYCTYLVFLLPAHIEMTTQLINTALQHEETEDAIICKYVDSEQLKWLKRGVQKFPESALMWQNYAQQLSWHGKYEDSMPAILKAEKLMNPENLTEVIEVANTKGHIMLAHQKYKEAVEIYEDLLTILPLEDVEAVDICICAAFCAIKASNWDAALKFYASLLEAEKQEFAFLTEGSQWRGMRRKLDKRMATVPGWTPPAEIVTVPSIAKKYKELYEDKNDWFGTNGKPLVINQRAIFVRELLESIPNDVRTVFGKTSDLSEKCTEELFIRNIDFTEDFQYTNHYLHATIITRPTTGCMTWTVIRDRLGECIMLTCIYAAQLKVGDKITIFNPRIHGGIGSTRMCVDSMTAIILQDRPYTNVCWYCGVPDTDVKLKKCSKCVAYYCSRECQVDDWKTMQHKDICFEDPE